MSAARGYAIDVKNGAFPMGEPAIASESEWAIEYAKKIKKGRFELAELTLKQTRRYWDHYVNYLAFKGTCHEEQS